MKVIFLDLDGVLIRRKSLKYTEGLSNDIWLAGRLHPDCVDALNYIIRATRAKIVISSTFRMFHPGGIDLSAKLTDAGLPDFYSMTPFLGRGRGNEIQAWLDHNLQVDSFVILDDVPDMQHLMGRLVKTDIQTGLTWEDAEEAIEMLNG